jgi:hypothetical protein
MKHDMKLKRKCGLFLLALGITGWLVSQLSGLPPVTVRQEAPPIEIGHLPEVTTTFNGPTWEYNWPFIPVAILLTTSLVLLYGKKDA